MYYFDFHLPFISEYVKLEVFTRFCKYFLVIVTAVKVVFGLLFNKIFEEFIRKDFEPRVFGNFRINELTQISEGFFILKSLKSVNAETV